MELKGFKTKCLACGKEVVTMTPDKKAFCPGKVCETNYKYADKFIDNRYWRGTPLKEE